MLIDESYRIQILVVDDIPAYRDAIRATIRSMPDVEIIGEAATGQQAIAQAQELQPDIILMDFNMPSGNGIEATREILAKSQHIRVIILTAYNDDDLIFNALKAGARGYLLKDAPNAEITRAIRSVYLGGAIFSAKVAERLLRIFNTPKPPSLAEAFPDLLPREQEILKLLAQGMSYDQIAKQMGFALKTVRNYSSDIFAKLQVHNKVEAIARALGVLKLDRSSSDQDNGPVRYCTLCGQKLP